MIARDGRRPATPTSAAALRRAPAVIVLGVLGAAAAAGCSDSAPHGAPQLLKVYWETRGGVQILVWPPVSDAGTAAASVPPAATQFDLVFDKVIDGSKIENTTTVNGVQMQVPKPQDAGPMMSPVTVTPAPGTLDSSGQMIAEPAGQNYALNVWYNSLHLPSEAANTSYVYGRETPSYPSKTQLQIKIDPNGITSKYNEPMKDVGPIMIMTDPFGVTINPAPTAAGTASDDAGPPPPSYVPTNFWIPLQFNNIPVSANPTALVAALPQYLQVRQNGVLLTPGQYQLQVSASDPTLVLVQPGSIQIWDSGGTLDVTVSAALPDVYGATLAQDATASFLPCQLVGQDGGVRICAPPIHGNATDGGATDGGAASDAPASDDVADAAVDADDAATD